MFLSNLFHVSHFYLCGKTSPYRLSIVYLRSTQFSFLTRNVKYFMVGSYSVQTMEKKEKRK